MHADSSIQAALQKVPVVTQSKPEINTPLSPRDHTSSGREPELRTRTAALAVVLLPNAILICPEC